MDLIDVRALERGPVLPAWQDGDAWLAGGTHLFGEPQPHVRRLLDLTTQGWAPHEVDADGLRIGATCTITQLDALADSMPTGWTVGPLVRACCEAFLMPLTVWHTATVGGNLCTALPAGPMTALAAALDGVAELLATDGTARRLPVVDLVTGDGATALAPGELLRAVRFGGSALRSRTALRRASLTEHGRSAVLLVGRVDPDGTFVLTVTASTTRPVQLRYPSGPDPHVVRADVDSAAAGCWHHDVHGAADWRRHLTLELAAQLADELGSRS